MFPQIDRRKERKKERKKKRKKERKKKIKKKGEILQLADSLAI